MNTSTRPSRLAALSVKAKISLGFTIVLLLHVAIATTSHYGLDASNASLSRFDRLHKETLAIDEFRETVESLQHRILLFTSTGHASHARRTRDIYRELAVRLEALESVADGGESGPQIEDMAAALEANRLLFEAVVVDRDRRKQLKEVELDRRVEAIDESIERLSSSGRDGGSIESVRAAMTGADLAALRYVHSPDSRHQREMQRAVDLARRGCDGLEDEGADAEAVARLCADLDGFESTAIQMIQATRGYLHLVNVVMAGQSIEFDRLTQDFRTERIGATGRLAEAIMAESGRIQRLSSIFSILTIGLGIGAGVWIARQIAPPLNSVTQTLERLAAGEPCDRIPGLDRGDEIGQLASAAQVFKERSQDVERLLVEATEAREEAQRARHEAETNARMVERKGSELEKARAAAVAASVAKSEFLANMSHEIRTPMTAILGYADLLDDRSIEDPAQSAEAAETIRGNARHLLTIINDILDMSKIEAGQLTTEAISMDPVGLARGVADLLRPRAEGKGIAVELAVADDVPATITSDPTRLRQILLNLAGNAVKFTESGTVRLEMAVDRPGERLLVTVRDTGIGMSDEACERIRRFEAFSQADTSTTRRFGGTGLGLRISHALAVKLGGGIEIQSTPGAGSAFTVSITTGSLADVADHAGMAPEDDLPVADRDARDGTSAEDADATPTAPSLADLRILVAEDGPDILRLISFHLRRAGAEVIPAVNGRIAVDTIQASGPGCEPDVVLMDMQMPELDGYSAARTLRAAGCRIPIIALTAHAMDEDRTRCLDAGCDDFLTKPVDRDALIARCRRVADARPDGPVASGAAAA